MQAQDWLGDVADAPAPRSRGGRPAKGYVGRQRKVECPCGFIAYVTRGALEKAGGLPVCACGEPMALANLRDRYAVEPDALERELERYGARAYAAAMRELGLGRMRVTVPSGHGGGRPDRKRCEWTSCPKFSSGRFCPEHAGYNE